MYPDEQTILLACEPIAVRNARQIVESRLRRRGWNDDDVERAKLAASELVANAVVHARTEAAMRLRIDRSVRLEVIDGAPEAFPQPRPPDPRRVGGMGLRLVAQVASDWGFETTSAGKSVWCEVEPQRPVASPPPDVGSTDQSPSDEHDRDRADRRGAAAT